VGAGQFLAQFLPGRGLACAADEMMAVDLTDPTSPGAAQPLWVDPYKRKPARLPVSRSAWRTHFRSVSAVQPTFSAIDTIAAHCELYSRSVPQTSQTALSRVSGEYCLTLLMTPASQLLGSPANPGRFNLCSGR
jgi:hypothetical protein